MAKAGQTHSTSDPVAEIGRRIVAIRAAIDSNEKASHDAGFTEQQRLEDEYLALSDTCAALEVRASHLQASSLVGAMLQLILVRDTVDEVLGFLVGEDRSAASEFRRRVDRLSYSILDVLAASSGVDPAEVGGDWYMAPRFNPHLWVGKVVPEALS